MPFAVYVDWLEEQGWDVSELREMENEEVVTVGVSTYCKVVVIRYGDGVCYNPVGNGDWYGYVYPNNHACGDSNGGVGVDRVYRNYGAGVDYH